MKKRVKAEWIPKQIDFRLDARRRTATVRGKAKSIRSIIASDWLWVAYLFLVVPAILAASVGVLSRPNLPLGLATALLGGIFCRAAVFPAFNIHGDKYELVIDFTTKHIRVGGKKYRRSDRSGPLSLAFSLGRDTDAEQRLATGQYRGKRAYQFGQSRALTLLIRQGAASGFDGQMPTGGGRVVELAKIIGEQEVSDFVSVCGEALKQTTGDPPAAVTADQTLLSGEEV